jgi:hypothetical protein
LQKRILLKRREGICAKLKGFPSKMKKEYAKLSPFEKKT